jgi:hypothetical protein
MAPPPAPLSVGWGYGIVLGLGSVFALGMVSCFLFSCVESSLLTTIDPRHLDLETIQP